MAKIGIAASLIQIAGAGVQLTRTLHEFAATTSAAREQVDYIGKNVSFYSDVLELLVEQFEHERPVHSRKAIALAEKLYDHSYDLFNRNGDLISDRHRTRDQISLIQKITWNFKKTRVALLVGKLENLKSTVQLLVQVLCAARQLRAYDEDSRRPSEKFTKREVTRRQYLRAENVLVEWQRTQESLPLLQEAVEREDLYSVQAASGSKNKLIPATCRRSSALVKSQNNSLAVIEAAAAAATGSVSDKGALVLRNTREWLEMLLDDWTVLSQEPLDGWEAADTAWRTAPPFEERRISHRSWSTDRSKDLKSLSAAEIEQGLDNTGERYRRVIPEPARKRKQRRPLEKQGDFPGRQARASANDGHEPSNLQTIPSSENQELQSEGIASGEPAARSGGFGSTMKTRSNERDTNGQRDAPSRYQHVDDDIGNPYLPAPANPFLAPFFDLSSPTADDSNISNDLWKPLPRTQRKSEIPTIEILEPPDPNPLSDAFSPNRRRALSQPIKAINGRYFFECPKENCDRKGERGFLNWQDLEEHLDFLHPLPLFTNDGHPVASERLGSFSRHLG